jgi:hypothetical protein
MRTRLWQSISQYYAQNNTIDNIHEGACTELTRLKLISAVEAEAITIAEPATSLTMSPDHFEEDTGRHRE